MKTINKKTLVILLSTAGILLVLFVVLYLASLKKTPLPKIDTLPTPTPFQTERQRKDIGAPGPNPTEYYTYEESVRKTRPDIYLSNRVPHEDQTFAISKIVNWNTGSILFIVSLKETNTQQSKGDAINWMKSLGLTDGQIQSLNISYQPETVVALKEKLPYYGNNFSITYDKSFDTTRVVIYEENIFEGELEFDAFLKTNGVSDRSLINNMTILYR